MNQIFFKWVQFPVKRLDCKKLSNTINGDLLKLGFFFSILLKELILLGILLLMKKRVIASDEMTLRRENTMLLTFQSDPK